MSKRRQQRLKERSRKRPAQQPTTRLPSRLIVPVSPHDRRMNQLGARFPTFYWRPDTALVHAYLKRQAAIDIGFQLDFQRKWERVRRWLAAEALGGSGFLLATSLRRFMAEFNERIIKHGTHALPSSFNIIEAFLQCEGSMPLFGLRPEREHLLDANDYFDWYSQNSPLPTALLMDKMRDGDVYSFDLISSDTGFRIDGCESQFVLAGMALVRHSYELSCFMIAGELPPRDTDTEAAAAVSAMKDGVILPGKEGLRPDTSFGVKDRYLEAYPDFARVIVLSRIDLRTSEHEVRYFEVDCGAAYRTITDDVTIFATLPPAERCRLEGIRPDFDRYDQLYSALASLIYLPVAFDALSAQAVPLEFPTELAARAAENEIGDVIRFLGTEHCALNRTINCLQTTVTEPVSRASRIDPPDLQFSREGFWKTLPPGQIGEDQRGTPIVGRTWVTRHDSWAAKNPSSFILKRSVTSNHAIDPGTVYIMRSPGHEKDLYKLGLSRRNADVRSRELSTATGVPLPFVVLASWEVSDCGAVEKEVHRRLEPGRVNPKREFFFGSLQDIVAVVTDVVRQCTLDK